MLEELQPLVPIAVDILKYAAYGGLVALGGYLKSENLPNGWKIVFTKEFWNKFSPTKALKTVMVGIFLGAFTRGQIYLPIEITQSADFLAVSLFTNAVIVLGVETLIKIIVRRTPLMRAWNGLKDAAVSLLERLVT